MRRTLSFAKGHEAQFPSVVSQRAVDQLIKLKRLLDAGYKVNYIFVSLNPKIRQLAINKTIEEYRDAYNSCIEKGMMVKGVSLKLKDGKPIIYSSLPVST